MQCPAVGRAFWWMFHSLVMSDTFFKLVFVLFFWFLFKGGKMTNSEIRDTAKISLIEKQWTVTAED